MQLITLASLVASIIALPQAQEYIVKPQAEEYIVKPQAQEYAVKPQLPFKGMTYSPYLPGNCASSQKVASDIKNIARYTDEVRLYGADCDQIEYVLSAITSQNLTMRVMLGAWTRDGDARFQRELSNIEKALSNPDYRSKITRVAIGNEDLSNGVSEGVLVGKIQQAKGQLAQYNVTIGTVEVGSKLTSAVAEYCDYLGLNIHPYFNTERSAAVDVKDAVQPINNYMSDIASKFPNKKLLITEIGFPTSGQDSHDYGVTSSQSQFEFLKEVRCQINKWQYFAFEAYDAAFKNDFSFGGIERSFGILNSNGQLKAGSVANLFQC